MPRGGKSNKGQGSPAETPAAPAVWVATDVGKKREHNEDSFLVDSSATLFAVADGMGGHLGGERASRMAVDVLARGMKPGSSAGSASPGERLRRAARTAGREIYGAAIEDPSVAGMGTTLTALQVLTDQRRAIIVHVGDSRAYLYRKGTLEQLTTDHTWIEEQVQAGFVTRDEVRTSELRHIVTRSLGYQSDTDVDLIDLHTEPDDVFLLCTDGLSNELDNERLAAALEKRRLVNVPQELVDAANDAGGDDNITVVLVKLPS